MKTGYYSADNDYGVQYYGPVMYGNVDVLSPEDFYDSLHHGGELYTYISLGDHEIYQKIEDEYGIKGATKPCLILT